MLSSNQISYNIVFNILQISEILLLQVLLVQSLTFKVQQQKECIICSFSNNKMLSYFTKIFRSSEETQYKWIKILLSIFCGLWFRNHFIQNVMIVKPAWKCWPLMLLIHTLIGPFCCWILILPETSLKKPFHLSQLTINVIFLHVTVCEMSLWKSLGAYKLWPIYYEES
jgi:hypothetical protein